MAVCSTTTREHHDDAARHQHCATRSITRAPHDTLGMTTARQRLLAAATSFVALGTAMLLRSGTAIGTRLFMNEELAHAQSRSVEIGVAWLLVVCVPALWFARVRVIAASVVLCVVAVLAWATQDQGGYPFSAWALPAQAMRIAAPLALLVIGLRSANAGATRTRELLALWIIRVATVLVFAVHGTEALRAHPWFVDLTIVSVRELLDVRWSQATAERLLMVVGVLDLAAAAMLLLTRSRAVILYMAQWGLFTSLLRLIAYGPGALGEVIVRMPHALLPLVLLPLAGLTRARGLSPSALFSATSRTPAHPDAGSRS